jgi:hypothetical protein
MVLYIDVLSSSLHCSSLGQSESSTVILEECAVVCRDRRSVVVIVSLHLANQLHDRNSSMRFTRFHKC